MHTLDQMSARSRSREWSSSKDYTAELERLCNEISEHVGTSVLLMDQLPEPYSFVMERYPEVASIIAKIKILKNDNTALWKRLGLSGAAGMYIRPLSLVLIMYSPKAPDDVVAVHELLHCAHDKMLMGKTALAQEDMTFRASIPYLKKTHEDDWIIDNYMLPFYHSVELASRQHGFSVDQNGTAKESARRHCLRIITEESGKAPQPQAETYAPDRFDFLD